MGWSLLVADRPGQVRWISYYSCRRGEADSNRPAVVCRPAGHQQQPQCHRSGRGRAGGLDQPDRPRLFRVSEREVALALGASSSPPTKVGACLSVAPIHLNSLTSLRAGMWHASGHPATGGYRRVYYQPASSSHGADQLTHSQRTFAKLTRPVHLGRPMQRSRAPSSAALPRPSLRRRAALPAGTKSGDRHTALALQCHPVGALQCLPPHRWSHSSDNHRIESVIMAAAAAAT